MNTKKIILTILFIMAISAQSFAHYLWVETAASGTLNQQQEIRVYFGEYTYGVIEEVKGENFPNVKDFSLWVLDSEGNKTQLQVTAQKDHYVAQYVPKSAGTYTVLLNNDSIDVIDYTEYDFGIFKTHYHSVAKFQVGAAENETIVQNEKGLSIKRFPVSEEAIKLQVFFKNKPLANNELKVFVKDLWSKTLETDENGMVSFQLPWDTKYIVETTFEERTPGTYKGEKYEFIWHCATTSLNP
ncbi:MAG: DUF4198 domain-containing protein [Bacteroidota bacterium]|nr:DUF4198 domain-containing protein [Bacteroidota bacterium]